MTPLEQIVFSAIEMGENSGLSREEIAVQLTSKIEGKQNRYKWKKKIRELEVTPQATGCEFTGNFLDDLDL